MIFTLKLKCFVVVGFLKLFTITVYKLVSAEIEMLARIELFTIDSVHAPLLPLTRQFLVLGSSKVIVLSI